MTTARIDELFKALEGFSDKERANADEIKKIKEADEKRDERNPLIHDAVFYGHIDTIRYLLDKKIIDANAICGYRTFAQETLLRIAITGSFGGDFDIAKMILNEYNLTQETLDRFDRGCRKNALWHAISYAKTDLIKLLLEKGANPDLEIDDFEKDSGTTSFIILTAKSQRNGIEDKKQIIELLLKVKKKKCTEIEEFAIECIRKGIHLKEGELDALFAVKKLIKEKAPRTEIELAALQAAENGYVETLKYLFDQGNIQPNTLLHNQKGSSETLLMASLRLNAGEFIPKGTSVAIMLLENNTLELANLNFTDPQTGNAFERVIRLRDYFYLRSLMSREVNPVDRHGAPLTQLMDELYGSVGKRNDNDRYFAEGVESYVKSYQAKKIADEAKKANEEAKKVAESVVDAAHPAGICETLTNWFFCCRRQKAAMRDETTNTENHEMREAKKLA